MTNNVDSYKINANYCLKDLASGIEALSNQYPAFLEELLRNNDIPLNTQEYLNHVIDWESIESKHFFFYDYLNNESEIRDWLVESEISSQEFVLVEFGPSLPIVKVSSNLFIENWNNFVSANGNMGTTVISESGKYFMEFTDRDFMLYSNFKIK